MLRKTPELGIDMDAPADLSLLNDADRELVKLAAQFPRLVEAAAQAHEPHRVAFYLHDFSSAFHSRYNQGNDDPSERFIVEHNQELTRARLELASAIGQIIRNGLGIMGVTAAEEM
jgi:arginyl-tRNA synthetase